MTIAEKWQLMLSSFEDIAAALRMQGQTISGGMAAYPKLARNIFYSGNSYTAKNTYPQDGNLADKLAFCKALKEEIKDAVNYSTVVIDDDTEFADYGNKIREIREFNVESLTLDEGIAYVPYSKQIYLLCGNDGFTFTMSGSIPTGLTMSEDGVLSGTPTKSGTYKRANITATRTSDGLSRTFKHTIRIAPRQVTVKVTFYDTDGNALATNTTGSRAYCYEGDTIVPVIEFYDYNSGDAVEVNSGFTFFVGSTKYTYPIDDGITMTTGDSEMGITVYNPTQSDGQSTSIEAYEGVTILIVYEATE